MARQKTKEELEKERKVKSLSYERKLKDKHSKFVVISLTLIVAGFLFFIFSPRIFREKPERYYTDIGSNVMFTGGSIKPSRWVYSKNTDMMQVEFTFISLQVITPDVEVNAATSFNVRTKSSKKLDSEIVYHEGNYYIANIYDVPDDFYCVSLRIKTVEDSKTYTTNKDGIGNQVIDELNEKESTETDREITSTAVIYTCEDAVERVYSINPLDGYIYRIKRIQSNINIDYAMIEENHAAIDSLNKNNENLMIKNNELIAEMVYMTSSEKQTNERAIENNNSQIKENNAKIRTYETKNNELYKEIDEYKEIIKRIAAENEGREYIAPSEPTENGTELFTDPVNLQQETTETATQPPSSQPPTTH